MARRKAQDLLNENTPEVNLIDEDEVQELLKEAKNNNTNLRLAIREGKELNKRLDNRTKWQFFLGLIATIATVLAFLLSHQATLIKTLNLRLNESNTKIESLEKQDQETTLWKKDFERRLIGRRIGDDGQVGETSETTEPKQ